MRVIVVSSQPAMVLESIRSQLTNCRPVAVPSVDVAVQEARSGSVVLIDLGDGPAGLEAARQLRSCGVSQGIVIIGSEASEGLVGVVGLEPPFTAPQLDAALMRARLAGELPVLVVSAQPAAVSEVLRSEVPGCLPVVVPTVEEVVPQVRPGSVVLLDLGAGSTGLSAARTLRFRGVKQGIVVIGSESHGGIDGVVALQPPFGLESLSNALRTASRHTQDALTTLDAGRGKESDAEIRPGSLPGPTVPGGSTPPAARDRTAGAAPLSPPQPPPVAFEQQDTVDAEGGSDAPGERAPVSRDSGLTDAPQVVAPVRREQVPIVPDVARRSLSEPQSGAGPTPGGLVTPGTGEQGVRGSGVLRDTVQRWRSRYKGGPETGDAPSHSELYGRLASIYAATSHIEEIAAELPIVTSRSGLVEAIVGAVVDEFEADTVGLWRRQFNGWVVVAHRGFTERAARLAVGFDQPLMAEIEATRGAILLDPVVSFQALVSGIGGGHTESFMAASVTAASSCLGILTVGRDHPFVEDDLDRLMEMAGEAAVGMGVADHIERMFVMAERAGSGGVSRALSIDAALPIDDVGEAWADARQAMEEGAERSRWSDRTGQAAALTETSSKDKGQPPGGGATQETADERGDHPSDRRVTPTKEPTEARSDDAEGQAAKDFDAGRGSQSDLGLVINLARDDTARRR